MQNIPTIESSTSGLQTLGISYFLYGQEAHEQFMAEYSKTRVEPFDFNIYGLGRAEVIADSIRFVRRNHTYEMVQYSEALTHINVLRSIWQFPKSMHLTMYVRGIQMFGSESQKKQWLTLCLQGKMTGCYAQSELAHGSDIQSLQTTAEYDAITDQIVINTPSLSAVKFWPGDIAFCCNYAMVFAKLIANGQPLGIHSFIVPIRDQQFRNLPGIEIGDAGPKYGLPVKDNGYLSMKNIRIPRKNMLRRYVSLQKDGNIEIKGNPKIGYAAMMLSRRMIACSFYKIFGQAVIIAGKYSLIRVQFKNTQGIEQRIIEYQTQQNKIISCLADYYALALGGTKLSKMCNQNFAMVTQKDDDSMMAETHNCLCLGKAFSTDTAVKGIETCRLACGGHGFSHYSGLPDLLQELTVFTTAEGDNTVMYIQLSRYLLKSYKAALSGKKIDRSVSYLAYSSSLLQRKITSPKNDDWSIHQLGNIIIQQICFLISQVHENLQDGNQNNQAGIREVTAAQIHAGLYYFESFKEAIAAFKGSHELKNLMTAVGVLFGINQIVGKSFVLVQMGLADPDVLRSLQVCKQRTLKELRQSLLTLLNGIGFPEDLINSYITGKNLYEDLLGKARSVDLNKGVIPAAMIVKKIQNLKPRL